MASTNSLSTTAETSSSGSASTTSKVRLTNDPECPTYVDDCSTCQAIGCRYCQVSPQAWDLKNAPSIIDYACIGGFCGDLIALRPGTAFTNTIALGQCSSIPSRKATVLPTTTTAMIGTTVYVPPISVAGSGTPDWWPTNWGPLYWFCFSLPVVIIITACCCVFFRWRGKFKRVHVESATQEAGYSWRQGLIVSKKKLSTMQWDFKNAGALDVEDLRHATSALKASVRDEEKGPEITALSRRCLTFWASNNLQVSTLTEVEAILNRHPAITVSFDFDWRQANDLTLLALAKLLQRKRGRCSFRTVRGGLGAVSTSPLTLSIFASHLSLAAVAEAISTANAEVDELSLELPPTSKLAASAPEPLSLSLAPLRLSSQELTLSRQSLGDGGGAVVCGFVRSWSSRLQVIRLLDCNLGDGAASAVAKLVSNRSQPSIGLKELNLSANRIGDKGAADIADALSILDSLERLLLERNRIGTLGAKALGLKLPRSNVRELVLGSHLGGNPIGPEGAQALAKSLDDLLPRAAANRATRLSALSLEDCMVGLEGAKALAECLPKSNLQVLSVARNQLGNEGAEVILKALPSCLISLDLAGNELTDSTANAVGEMFYNMPRLAVSLAQNSISPTIRMLLTEEHGTRLRV